MPFASQVERQLAESLATRLRTLRATAGLTQEQVAEAAGISRQHYQLFESGLGNRSERSTANPTLGTLVALAEVLHTTVPDLIDEVFGRPPRQEVNAESS